MIRKACIAGIMALSLSAGAPRTFPAVGRFVSSAHSVQKHFRELKNSGSSMSPIERFVFSLILANTTTAQPPAPDRCT